MERLLQDLFKKEFVIDENPEPVLDLSHEAHSRRELRISGALAEEKVESKTDLVNQIAIMLREQDRLEALTSDLRNRSQAPTQEEFAEFFKRALTILDSFDRVMQFAEQEPPSEETQNWIKTLGGIQTRALGLFERHWLRSMDPIGKPLDLDQHEVVEVIDNDSIPDETVVEVRQKGYVYNGKVLRDARVVIARNERR